MSETVLTCPRCSGTLSLRGSRRRWFDLFFRWFGLNAYRCRLCRTRFHSGKPLPDLTRGLKAAKSS